MSPINTQHDWSLRKQIFDYLSGQIEKGTLTPGSLINVRKLTEELNISRTPLREALAQMEVQGLVTIMPQRGVKINALTYEQLLNIFEILGALESQVLRTVFDRITPKRIETMEILNERMAQYIDEEKNRRFHETNIQLHRVFLDLSSNKELTNYVGILKLRLFGFALKSYRDRFKTEIVKEHRKLVIMLRSGEQDKAVNFLQEVHWKFAYPANFIRAEAIG
ncbi:MAG: GntR family transcriptional regulator [Proteobacteria bacterium]|nr:GntR family transcriptional regulator [Pseudomonadota bacterium]